MVTERFLIVTADDFGLHHAINDAVERASRSGVLTAASLMVGGPAAADAVRRARLLPRLRVGLHLVMADGWAVLSPPLIPDLVDSRGWMDGKMFTRGLRFFASPAVRRQLEAEIRAQFEAFVRTGLVLDHVNAHKHFHLHPSLLDMVMRIGADYGIRSVRIPEEPHWFAMRGGVRLAGLAGGIFLRPWLALMRVRLRAAGLDCNDQIFGIARSGRMDESALLEIIAKLPPGVTEIYLHPATASEAPLCASMPNYSHADELAALVSLRVRVAIESAGVRCGGYRDLPRSTR